MHKESGFLCRERRARGKGAAESGARRKRVGIQTRDARETLPSISWHAKGIRQGGWRGIMMHGEDGRSSCAEKARATGLWTRGERTEKLLILY